MYKTILLFLILLLPLGCGDDDQSVDFSDLYSEELLFEFNRESKSPDLKNPADTIQESEYSYLSETKFYTVKISEDGNSILIEPGTVKGNKNSNIDSQLYFELEDGTFAGGRFIILKTNSIVEAELTYYGSGVPVTESLRGFLYQTQ